MFRSILSVFRGGFRASPNFFTFDCQRVTDYFGDACNSYCCAAYLHHIKHTQTMKNDIKNQIDQLDKAYKAKLIGTDEYCSQLHSLLKQLQRATA